MNRIQRETIGEVLLAGCGLYVAVVSISTRIVFPHATETELLIRLAPLLPPAALVLALALWLLRGGAR